MAEQAVQAGLAAWGRLQGPLGPFRENTLKAP